MKLARLHKYADTEPYWHVQLAVLVAIGLQLVLSNDLTLVSKYLMAGGEALLLVILTLFSLRAGQFMRHLRRFLAILLIALISLANISSLGLIINQLLSAHAINGKELLISALAIYLTNIIIFGLWYWELDSPTGTDAAATTVPADFLFPQMGNNNSTWNPTFFDYLYVSITNASAFSPTDTLPLTHRAKLLMTLQSLTSLVTVALVAARAVNILS